MNNCPWEEILGFRNHYELNSFSQWLEKQVSGHAIEEIEIPKKFSSDNYNEKGFIHKESNSIWKLIWTKGPSYISSFRSIENQDKCPWNEITDMGKSDEDKCGFKNYEDFENFAVWIEKQVEAGIAKEITIEEPLFRIGDDPSGEKWYVHIGSDTKWKLVWPDGPCKPYFRRIENAQNENTE